MTSGKNVNLNMITPEGGLNLALKPDTVTWFQFLQISRITNSRNGGWNFKSYWQDGLKRLETAKYLKQWTKNSMKAGSPPCPRKKDFMFDRGLSIARKYHKEHGCLRRDECLDELSENEINTRLFHHTAHGLWGKWIGYEIPLSGESDGQLKVDLMAIREDDCSLAIIELKQAGNTGDSPLMALTEAICYGIQALRCDKHLLPALKETARLDGEINKIRLILAAPEKYWKHFNFTQKHIEPMERIVASVNKGLAHVHGKLLFDESSICHLERDLHR